MLRIISILLFIFSLNIIAGTGVENPKNWKLNSNGKMTISYDSREKAVKFNVKFRPGKNLWFYPKIDISKIPADAKFLSFETRSSQLDNKLSFRGGFVMFVPVRKNISYKSSNNWQTIKIDLDKQGINASKLKRLQIGLHGLKSTEVTLWLCNIKFISKIGKDINITVVPPKTAAIKKSNIDIAALKSKIPIREKWESPAIPAIAKPTGFFQVKKHNGIWWFVDPEGKPFYSIGVNYCMGVGMDWPPRSKSDYVKSFIKNEPLCKKMAPKYKKWNFNTCGSVRGNWNGRFPATPVFRVLHYVNYAARKGNVPMSKKYNFVDVYSPEFKKVCETWAKIAIKPEANNPLIIGWFVDNEFHLPQDEAFQDQFYQVVIGAIRKYDKNHILLGTRFEAPNRSDMDIKMVGKYCDVISVNSYEYPHDIKKFNRLYKLSGRPVIIGEFTSAAKENGMTNSKYWRGTLFENQADRAKGYERYVSDIAALPYVVGAHYFMFTDRNEPTLNNWGLRDKDGKLYYEFVRKLAEVNKRLPLIHEGKLKPRKFPDLKCAVNDNPQTKNTAKISKDGKSLWQMASLFYTCTPGTAPYYFNRNTDENWGFTEGGFIEYRFDLKKPINNAYLIIRYGSFPNSTTNKLNIEINDDKVAVATCPKATKNLTTPKGWAYGFSLMKLTTVSIPLNMNIPAGYTNIRFSVVKPWKLKQGIRMHVFFISSGPAKVDPNNYYKLNQ